MLNEHLWSLSSGVHTQVVGPMTSFWAHFRHILAPISSQPPSIYFFDAQEQMLELMQSKMNGIAVKRKPFANK